MIRRLIGGGLTVSAGSSLILYNYNEDFKRSATLFKELGPIITHYRFIEAKQKHFPKDESAQDEEWNYLHNMYSDRVMETLRDLRGFYIKVAQVM
jgi:predicted unusual protein kinase regulating ubiquinone biosynthesis (AarF/ABC1/UbiB family)